MILNSYSLKLLALCVSHGKFSYVFEIFIQDKFETHSRTVPRFSYCIQANINEVNLIYQKLLSEYQHLLYQKYKTEFALRIGYRRRM